MGVFKRLSDAWRYISFGDVEKLLRLGLRGEIDEHSVAADLPPGDMVGVLLNKFTHTYNDIKDAGGDNPRRRRLNRTTRSLVRIFNYEFLIQLLYGLLETAIRIAGPLFFRRYISWLIDYDRGRGTVSQSEGWMWGVLLSSVGFLFMITHHRFFLQGCLMGFRMRQMLIAAIHSKVLRLNTASVAHLTSGQVVNLISNDVRRFDDAMPFLVFVILGPLELVVVTVLISKEVGFLPALAGVSTMMLLVPGQAILSKYIGWFRRGCARWSDKRIHLLGQLVSGSMAVKMLGWEDPFIDEVKKLRKEEKKYLMGTSLIRGSNQALNMFISFLAAFTTFATVWGIGKTLDVTGAFYVIVLLSLPKLSMALFFVLAVEKGAELVVSLDRLDKFLSAPEPPKSDRIVQGDGTSPGCVSLAHLDFSWATKEPAEKQSLSKAALKKQFSTRTIALTSIGASIKKPKTPKLKRMRTLKDISLAVEPGELLGVAGRVGSGKSSLLSALLGEMQFDEHLATGVTMCGRVAYVSQVPWVKAGTVRENIVFGQPFDEEKYQTVIEACALLPDIQRLPAGDATELGERGINLSGGQKARLCLARAAYSEADIQLLDDPLSAVDPHVARILFDKCIGPQGIMQRSTRILVTHQRQFLPRCDQVAVMQQGGIAMVAPWERIKSEGFEDVFGKPDKDGMTRVDSEVSLSSIDTVIKAGCNDEISGEGSSKKVSAKRIQKEGREKDADGELVNPEGKESGNVSWKVYWDYIVFIGAPMCAIIVVLCFLTQGVFFVAEWWLSQWANADHEDQQRSRWIGIYSAVTFSGIAFAILFGLLMFTSCIRGSSKLHNQMVARVMRSPLKFFHTNPTGRVVNRFSKDQGMVDELLPTVVIEVMAILTVTFGTLVLTGVAVPVIIPLFLIVLVIFMRVRRKYVVSSREVKRFEGTTRSPIYAIFSENLKGLATIRAYGAHKEFEKSFLECMDANGAWWYAFMVSSRWVGFRLDGISASLLAGSVLLSMLLRKEVSPEIVALAMSRVLQLTGALQWAVRQSAELENLMTSVERMLEYSHLEQEPPRVSEGGGSPPPKWPSSGAITYENVTATYRSGLSPVLKDLKFEIPGGASVGVVGRTGSGKSSLMLTLYRLIDVNSGKISIDGVDTSTIGVDALRRELAIIPQDPMLFSGTLRMNLDPWKESSDHEIWKVLSMVQLKELVEMVGGLDAEMKECGENLSTGERQLMCLARALLKDASVVALDEATANVDRHTDAMIQTTLREWAEQKKHSGAKTPTLLVIAHRIDTIMDCDYLVVLHDGELVEFGPPSVLMNREGGTFAAMVEAAKTAANMQSTILEDSDHE
ncbi:hypothetical protein BSKO_03316 [Bryopsis sp. KO-2023]|nr:hypothetical protein BSKO_03316 [Bryopsis sp. KO-2023]